MREIDWEGAKGAYFGERNTLYRNGGGGFTGVHSSQFLEKIYT